MSKDETRVFEGQSKLLEQILSKLEVLDLRLQHVESKIEQRGFDTKPIWERALAEIMEVKLDVAKLNRKMDVFSRDVLNLRAEQMETEERLRRIEAKNEDGGITTIQ